MCKNDANLHFLNYDKNVPYIILFFLQFDVFVEDGINDVHQSQA